MRRICMFTIASVLAVGVGAALSAPGGFPPFLRTWGQAGSAPGSFDSPDMVAVDARGQVYVADRQNNRVEKFDYRGRLLAVIGTPGSGPDQFKGPRGVAVDGVGDLFVADTGNNRIQKFDLRGHLLAVWGRNGGDGSPGLGLGQFNDPRGIATDRAGDLYVADHGNNRVQKLSPRGAALAVWGRDEGDGSAGTGDGEFTRPRGVTVDRMGDIYVADKENNRIQKFDPLGRFLTRWGRNGGDGTPGTGNGEFHIPYSVAAGADQLYVADTGNNRLQEFTLGGRFLQRFGRNGGDGSAGSAAGQFSTPYGVAVDCHGDLYVSDEGNNRIQVLGRAGGPPPICPPTLHLGRLSTQMRHGALVLTATCDQPCAVRIHSIASDSEGVRRKMWGASLPMGVEQIALRIPVAAPRATRPGEQITVRVTVRPIGFAGSGQSLTRHARLRAV